MIYRSLGQTNLTSETLIRFLMDNDRWEVIETIYYSSPVLLSITLLVFTHFFALFKYKINLIKLPSFIIFLIGLTSGIIGMTTNNDYNMVDLTLILISSFILINSLPKHSVRMSDGFLFIRTFYFMGICILIFYGIYIGLIRYRVMSTGSDLYYQDRKYKLTVITSSDNFFHNMSASPILITTLTNLERLHSSLEKYHIPKNRYYFGPRVDFAYAMFNIPPPKGLPLWWGEINEARGVPKGKTGLLVNLFINSDIKTVVFLENDYQFIPAEIKAFLRKEFLFCHLGNLDVYLRFGITDSCPENILFSES